MTKPLPDFVVIGAGVFGVWIALTLRRRGYTVTLFDAYGAGNNRSSSGDESRIIRMGYGRDALYTRWSARSLPLWEDLSRATGRSLFIRSGVLWLSRGNDAYAQDTLATLQSVDISHETLPQAELSVRFPQIAVSDISMGIFEPGSGVLLARQAVRAVFDEAVRSGVQYDCDAIVPAQAISSRMEYVQMLNATKVHGGTFIFACGAWLPGLFPDVLGDRIFPTRQEVFYFGTPAGAREFRPPRMPVWLLLEDEMYGLPDVDSRGIKVACDRHGEPFDPENGNRVASALGERQAKSYLGHRVPRLKDAPLLETRVCQYENTSNGDFLLDRHPEMENVWLAGGGSGHGFKHGPMVGEYLTRRLLGEIEPEPRFSLASKLLVQRRAVY
jgi:glycine/D-amino acid oxidase-like deaminating enzyme